MTTGDGVAAATGTAAGTAGSVGDEATMAGADEVEAGAAADAGEMGAAGTDRATPWAGHAALRGTAGAPNTGSDPGGVVDAC